MCTEMNSILIYLTTYIKLKGASKKKSNKDN